MKHETLREREQILYFTQQMPYQYDNLGCIIHKQFSAVYQIQMLTLLKLRVGTLT